MSDRNWQKLWSIFQGAVDLSPDERAAYLDQACGYDDELRDRVEGLLAADVAGAGVLDRAIDQTGLLSGTTDEIPSRIGPYRVVRELGRGGMGEVYLGRRDDAEFDQQVAIKVVPLGRYSESVLKRFLQERQILSNLNHQHIARLFDGGTTDEGVPYLIMEHVDGQTIDGYCASRDLSLTDRLYLFLQVCNAVHYAHQQLIVHRDIKPGNVLVDADGRPKLLDFGIAKLLEPGPAESVPATDTVSRVATPEYASPEQLRGEPLSTATDIYSLGVLLYELLTGQRPFEVDRSDLESIVRSISLEQPPKPSFAVTPDGVGQSKGLRRRLRGDLDNIVMMALRKDPARRYASAAQFAQDIELYLQGFPVQARPETFFYRSGKFITRHPLGVAASVATLALLIGFSFTSYRQAKNLEVALSQAIVEREKASRIADFLRDLFRAPDPMRAQAESLTIEDLLDAGAGKIHSELEGQPEVQASLMGTLAEVRTNLSQFEQAESLATQAVEIHTRVNGGEHPNTLEAMLTKARILFLQDRHKDALAICQSVESTVRANPEIDPLIGAGAQIQCATALTFLGKYSESIVAANHALTTRQQLQGDSHSAVAQARTALGQNYWYLGDYDAARIQYEAAAQILGERLGPAHPRSVSALADIASLEVRTGNLARGEKLYRKILAQRLEVLGRSHSRTASSYNQLGVALLRQGQYDEAEDMFDESVSIYTDIFGANAPASSRPLGNLALLYTETQRYDEALALHQDLLARDIAAKGADHWTVGSTYNNMGLVWQNKRDLEQAEDSFRKAHAIIRKAWGVDHPGLAYSLNNLAIVLFDQGKTSEAETNFKEALKLRRKGLEADDPALASTLHEYGRLLLDTGRNDEARSMIDEALSIRDSKLSDSDWRTQHTRVLKGVTLANEGELEDAEAMMLPATQSLVTQLGPDHWRSEDARRRTQALLSHRQ